MGLKRVISYYFPRIILLVITSVQCTAGSRQSDIGCIYEDYGADESEANKNDATLQAKW